MILWIRGRGRGLSYIKCVFIRVLYGFFFLFSFARQLDFNFIVSIKAPEVRASFTLPWGRPRQRRRRNARFGVEFLFQTISFSLLPINGHCFLSGGVHVFKYVTPSPMDNSVIFTRLRRIKVLRLLCQVRLEYTK